MILFYSSILGFIFSLINLHAKVARTVVQYNTIRDIQDIIHPRKIIIYLDYDDY